MSGAMWMSLVGGRMVAVVHERARGLTLGISGVQWCWCVRWFGQRGQRGWVGFEVFDLGLWPERGRG
jgi:hypothetical protein